MRKIRFNYALDHRQLKTYGPIDGELVVALIPDGVNDPRVVGYTTVRHRDYGMFYIL